MLLSYIEAFQSLTANNTKKDGVKPYKPALLLAVIAGIEAGQIQNNQIIITPELLEAFQQYRQRLGATTKYVPRHFIYPFFHLKTEKFWELKPKSEMKLPETNGSYVGGLKQLQEVIAYAELDRNLWELLQVEKVRAVLRSVLLATYSPT